LVTFCNTETAEAAEPAGEVQGLGRLRTAQGEEQRGCVFEFDQVSLNIILELKTRLLERGNLGERVARRNLASRYQQWNNGMEGFRLADGSEGEHSGFRQPPS